MENDIINIEAVIDYIESHLDEKLDLEKVSEAVHYSKYHLHRLFTNTVGITIHDYVQYRDKGTFYPLQLRFVLHKNIPSKVFTKEDNCIAETGDIPAWMDLMRLVIDGYPVKDEMDYLKEITKAIEEKRAPYKCKGDPWTKVCSGDN